MSAGWDALFSVLVFVALVVVLRCLLPRSTEQLDKELHREEPREHV